MKKMTLRVDDYVYDRINLIAKENKTSANKVMVNMVKDTLNRGNNIDYSKEIKGRLNYIISMLDELDKRSRAHFKVSKQHFANRGFLSNAEISKDKMLNTMFKNKFEHLMDD